MDNTIDALLARDDVDASLKDTLRGMRDMLRDNANRNDEARLQETQNSLVMILEEMTGDRAPLRRAVGGKRRTQSAKFGSCVKAVRKTVKARKGSNPESAAIAICTKSILHPRGRTIKRYRKGRLVTQKRRT
jgi:hypothetical protein